MPHDILRIRAKRQCSSTWCKKYRVLYRRQRVEINDKHIEAIIARMLRKGQDRNRWRHPTNAGGLVMDKCRFPPGEHEPVRVPQDQRFRGQYFHRPVQVVLKKGLIEQGGFAARGPRRQVCQGGKAEVGDCQSAAVGYRQEAVGEQQLSLGQGLPGSGDQGYSPKGGVGRRRVDWAARSQGKRDPLGREAQPELVSGCFQEAKVRCQREAPRRR